MKQMKTLCAAIILVCALAGFAGCGSKKIEVNPKDPRYLKVVWGVGYKVEKL